MPLGSAPIDDPLGRFVAYYRVSTEKQGVRDAAGSRKGKERGLGIDAQKTDVLKFIGSTSELVAEFVEVESGKSHTTRPQLLAALAECKKRKARLVIAKLDRLSRNVTFISSLLDSNVDFVCCDNPHANPLMIRVLAAFAQHEREQISLRVKAALAELKSRGVILGSPLDKLAKSREKAAAANLAKGPAPAIIEIMKSWRRQRLTYAEVAHKLNELNVKPARGKKWYGSSVRNQLIRVREEKL
jgi:DNA invertase Pin-like site-specific DNA recombinase